MQILLAAVMSLFEAHRFQGLFKYSGLSSASTLSGVGDFVLGAPVQKTHEELVVKGITPIQYESAL